MKSLRSPGARTVQGWAGALVALLGVGCSASSQYMRPTVHKPLAAPPAGGASVVFLRPSEFGSAVSFQLFDEQKRFLGDALAGTYWEVVMEPGMHWFYADAENAGVMRAELAAGRRYYVVVRPYMGAWSARVELTGLSPRFVDWQKRDEWLAGAEAMAVDHRGGQADLLANAEDVDEAIREAGEIWQETDEEWHAEHSLRPEDGEGYAAAPRPAQPAPQPAVQPAPQPAPQPAVQPAPQPAAEPTPQPVASPPAVPAAPAQ